MQASGSDTRCALRVPDTALAGLTIEPATKHDSLELSRSLRSADIDELRAVDGDAPLLMSVEQSRAASDAAYTVRLHGGLVVMFGIVVKGGYGRVWLLGTDLVETIPMTFLRLSRPWLRALAKGCEMTWNLVDCRNEVHLTWLRWLGYSFLRKIRYGMEQRDFWLFARAEDV